MAELTALDIDEQGYVKSGRFAGQHMSAIVQYAETLETAIREDGAPPPKPEPPAPKPDPNDALNKAAAGRVDAATLLTWQRLEQDDERDFSRTVDDYGTYAEKVAEAKKSLQPHQRIVSGVHKFLYAMVKQQDPKVQEAIFGKPSPPPPPEPPADPSVPVPPTPPPAEPVKPSAQPAPPVAKPTPARPTPTPAVKVAKLKANEKVTKSAKAWGIPVDEYLLQLEEQGVTQVQLDAQTAPSNRGNRRSVYDRI